MEVWMRGMTTIWTSILYSKQQLKLNLYTKTKYYDRGIVYVIQKYNIIIWSVMHDFATNPAKYQQIDKVKLNTIRTINILIKIQVLSKGINKQMDV